jgi:molybdopterin-containing oxidoreductase family membrane subunit
MVDQRAVLGIFKDEKRVAQAVKALQDTSWTPQRVFSPFPSKCICEALQLKTSPVGLFTLGGAVLGFVSGFILSVYTATEWNLIVSGKPVIAWIPFLIVAFEFTVLFAVFGNVAGLLFYSRLPDFETLRQYDARCSGEHFGILANCSEGEEEELAAFFQDRGGESRRLSEEGLS